METFSIALVSPAVPLPRTATGIGAGRNRSGPASRGERVREDRMLNKWLWLASIRISCRATVTILASSRLGEFTREERTSFLSAPCKKVLALACHTMSPPVSFHWHSLVVIDVKEIRVEQCLNNSRKDGDRLKGSLKSSLGKVAIHPVGDIKSAVNSQRE